MSKNIRINIYIRPMTKKLLDSYCEINELDMSRAVDDLLYGRLKYLEEAEKKANKKIGNKEWVDNFWKNFQA